jgi:hypothetical protein
LPPQQRAGKSATVLIVIGAVLLTLGILGNFAHAVGELGKKSRAQASKTSMRVGECITQSAYLAESFSSRSSNDDCGNPANTYLLAAKGGASATCPDGARDDSVYDRYSDTSTLLCFALNLKQDRCYQVAGDVHHPRLSLGDCDSVAPGLFRVVQRIDGSTDRSQCPPGSKAIGYPTPAVVYCLDRASP